MVWAPPVSLLSYFFYTCLFSFIAIHYFSENLTVSDLNKYTPEGFGKILVQFSNKMKLNLKRFFKFFFVLINTTFSLLFFPLLCMFLWTESIPENVFVANFQFILMRKMPEYKQLVKQFELLFTKWGNLSITNKQSLKIINFSHVAVGILFVSMTF